MPDLITQAPLLAATVLACQLILLAEFWMYYTLNPAYFRLSLPLSGIDLPPMPTRDTAGASGTVRWDGDAQLIRFRRRLDLFGRDTHGHGLLARAPDGTLHATWAPRPSLTLLLSPLPILALIFQADHLAPPGIIGFFLVGIALHVWLARRTVVRLLADLKEALAREA